MIYRVLNVVLNFLQKNKISFDLDKEIIYNTCERVFSPLWAFI